MRLHMRRHSEVTPDAGHAMIASGISNFMAAIVLKSSTAAEAVDQLVDASSKIAAPIIESQAQEAFIHM